MRYVRQVLEVVVPQTEKGNTSEARDFNGVCWNVFLIDDDGDKIVSPSGLKYSLEVLDKLCSIKEKIFLIKKGMTRVLSHHLGSGFYEGYIEGYIHPIILASGGFFRFRLLTVDVIG